MCRFRTNRLSRIALAVSTTLLSTSPAWAGATAAAPASAPAPAASTPVAAPAPAGPSAGPSTGPVGAAGAAGAGTTDAVVTPDLPANDPQLVGLLARLTPGQPGMEGSPPDGAGPGGLDLVEMQPVWVEARRAGVAALLQQVRSGRAGPAAAQALASLQRGEVNLLIGWLAEREAVALKQARADNSATPPTPAIDHRQQVARLARQQAVLALPVDAQIALAAFRRVLEHDGNDPWSQIAVGDLLAQANDQAGAAGAYQAAVPVLQRQLAQARAATGTEASQRGLSHALMLCEFRTGEVRAYLEQREVATAAYARALALGEDLLAKEPEEPQRQFEVQTVSDRLAEQLTAQNQWGAALAAHQRSLALARTLAAGDPEGEATWQFYLLDKHEHIADLQLTTGAPDLALESYRTGLALGEKLVARDITNDAWLGGLLGLIAKVGSISTMAQTGEERRQLLLRGLELLSRVRSGDIWDNSEEWGDRLRQSLGELPNPSEEEGS